VLVAPGELDAAAVVDADACTERDQRLERDPLLGAERFHALADAAVDAQERRQPLPGFSVIREPLRTFSLGGDVSVLVHGQNGMPSSSGASPSAFSPAWAFSAIRSCCWGRSTMSRERSGAFMPGAASPVPW
jgi:hypothetical protein